MKLRTFHLKVKLPHSEVEPIIPVQAKKFHAARELLWATFLVEGLRLPLLNITQVGPEEIES
jgi:hypothetical protein